MVTVYGGFNNSPAFNKDKYIIPNLFGKYSNNIAAKVLIDGGGSMESARLEKENKPKIQHF